MQIVPHLRGHTRMPFEYKRALYPRGIGDRWTGAVPDGFGLDKACGAVEAFAAPRRAGSIAADSAAPRRRAGRVVEGFHPTEGCGLFGGAGSYWPCETTWLVCAMFVEEARKALGRLT